MDTIEKTGSHIIETEDQLDGVYGDVVQGALGNQKSASIRVLVDDTGSDVDF